MPTTAFTSRIIETKLILWNDLKFNGTTSKKWVNNGDKKLLESILKLPIYPFRFRLGRGGLIIA
jgi:hypothetical protein